MIAVVHHEGDEAVRQYTRELDTGGADPPSLLVSPEELDDAIRSLPLEVVAGLQVAIANVAQVSQASVGEDVATSYHRASASPCASCRCARRRCTCRAAALPTRARP